jgi:hypothetical protein
VGIALLAVVVGVGVAYLRRDSPAAEPDPPKKQSTATRERAAAVTHRGGPLRLWKGETLRAGGKVVALAFAPRGNVLMAAIADGAGGVRCWDWATGQRREHFWPGVAMSSVACAADGRELAAGGGESVRWWLADGAEETVRTRGPVRAIAFSPDGKHFAAAVPRADLGRIDILVSNLPARRPRRTLEGPASESCALAISAHAPELAAGADGRVQL